MINDMVNGDLKWICKLILVVNEFKTAKTKLQVLFEFHYFRMYY